MKYTWTVFGEVRGAFHVQGTTSSPRKTRSKPSTGRDTVLSAVGKLPIDILMGSMHGALMD